jgi:GNAT superfamily N-acetyltransferase
MTLQVLPATASRWPDVMAVFTSRRSQPDSCWCQRFRPHAEPSNRAALQFEVETAETAVGLLAYVDDRPAGWSRVVPRHTLDGIRGNRALQRLLVDDEAAWWVTCFMVRPEQRGSGLAVALLTEAVEYARQHGASTLDGHPVDVAMLKGRAAPAALFTGTSATFEAVGFAEIGRTYPSRPVMRRTFDQ